MQSTAIALRRETRESVVARVSADLDRRATKEQAAKAVAVIAAACRKRTDLSDSEATEVQIRLDLIRELLIHYPASVVDELIHPYGGITGEAQYLPTVAEVKKFADRLTRRRTELLSSTRREIEQLAERAKSQAPRVQSEYRERRVARLLGSLRAKTAEEMAMWRGGSPPPVQCEAGTAMRQMAGEPGAAEAPDVDADK